MVVVIISILATLAIPHITRAIDKANNARAIGDIKALQAEISDYDAEHHTLPNSLEDIGRAGMLDPWGNEYVYVNLTGTAGNGSARKDRFMVPLNDDYDLYSKGKDGESRGPLQSKVSHDDIIRASDGSWVGVAENN